MEGRRGWRRGGPAGMSAACFSLHGLTVAAALPVAAHPGAGPAHVRFIGLHRAADVGRPGDRPLLYEAPAHAPMWIAARTTGGYTVGYPGHVEFHLDADLETVEAVARPDMSEEWIALLFQGAVVAALCTFRGVPALHATTVTSERRAFALAGASGAGKTTVAALLLACGQALLSDDVTVMGSADGLDTVPAHHVAPGLLEVRLRPKAQGLADLIPGRQRTTADDRLAVRPHAVADQPCGLSAVVFPRPDRSGSPMELRRLDPVQAIPMLLRALRLPHWRDPAMMSVAFGHAADLAGRHLCWELVLPWHDDPRSIDARAVHELVTSIP